MYMLEMGMLQTSYVTQHVQEIKLLCAVPPPTACLWTEIRGCVKPGYLSADLRNEPGCLFLV